MRLRLVVTLFCLAAAPPALAQQEPPSRVGSVSYASGTLAFHAPGDTQWSAAGVNYPVATGGSFWTEPQARAEIQIGPDTLAMDGGTEVDVTNLNEQVAQIGVPQGRVHLHVRQLGAGQSFEVDVPQGAVWLLQPGSYDIDAGGPDRGGRLAVFAGSARFSGGGADLAIHSGNAASLNGTSPVAVSTTRAAPDAFVEWCSTHDYHEDHLASPYYVSPRMTGYSSLDSSGNWQSNPQYGEVWYPSGTPADWAPYRDGRWIWVPPWGWTWVDQQPWGFAPFHYGRWAYVDDRWGWVPGSYEAAPVYAPALVAFVGLGAAVGAAAGPSVGWFPLAPGEAYWPSYTRDPAYVRSVNVGNVKNINTVMNEWHGAPPAAANAEFANRRFATVVPQRVFASAAPVAPAVVHVPPAALQKAPVAVRPPQVAPAAAHAAVAGPPRPLPGTKSLGASRIAPGAPVAPPAPGPGHPGAPGVHPAATAALPPPRPGEIRPAEHNPLAPAPPATAAHPTPPGPPGGPGAHPATTAALPPPRPGEVRPAERNPVAPAPPSAAAAHATPPGPRGEPGAHPPNTAALPPHPGATAAPHAAPAAAPGPAHPPPAESARREALPEAAPERRPPAPAAARPAAVYPAAAPPPHPAAPPHPAPQAQVVHPPVVHAPAAHPPPALARPVAAQPHPAAGPAPAARGAPPARGGKPPEKSEEHH